MLAGVVSVVLRNTPSTEARADDPRSMMGLVTWFPQVSTRRRPRDFDMVPTTASDCNISPGTNLLRLKWTEKTTVITTTYVANYRHVPTGSGLSRIQRITCSGTGSPPYTNGKATNLTSDLPALPSGWVAGTAPVAVSMSALDGSVQLVANSRSPRSTVTS